MRVKTRSYRFMAYSLIFLSAVFLCLFALTVPTAAADVTTGYLEAEVTLGGEFLPSTLLYTGSDFNLGFQLYKSEDMTEWVRDEDADHISDFEVKIYDAAGALLSSLPRDVGSYRARVIAKDPIPGFKNTDATPRIIVQNVVVAEKSFSIVRENLSLFCTPLDRVSSLVLDDTHADYYSAVTSGISLSLAGQTLTNGSDYSFVVQYYSGGAYVSTASISSVGTYRIKVNIKPTVDLSRTVASSSLAKEGDDYVLYREFSVTRAAIDLALNRTSMYEDATASVTLTSASQSGLASIVSASYETAVILTSSQNADGTLGRVVASSTGSAVSYTPSECGNYLYRVTFTADAASYGIAAGDYMDLAFTVNAVPYTVAYWINNEETDVLDYVINNPENEVKGLSPVFYNLQGQAIRSVYDADTRKFSVSYEVYNTALSDWQSVAAPQQAGRYRVIVTFTADATIVSGEYVITSGTVLPKKEFQVVTTGSLSVTAANGGVNYYTGSALTPAISFVSAAVTGVSDLVEGKYDLHYFAANGSALGSAPFAVGSYFFELVFNQTIPEIGVASGAVYRGAYRIVYRPLEVEFGSGVTFRDAVTGDELSLVLDTDYKIDYYRVTDRFYSLCDALPDSAGNYMERVSFLNPFPIYHIAAKDAFSYTYSIAGSNAMIDIGTSALDLTYDGGMKEPTVTFSLGITPLDALNELADYQISYFKYDGNNYLPCGQPLFAGSYRAVVTILKTDEAQGLIRGAYKSADFTIAPLSVGVFYSVSESSADLVYDATEKTFDVELKIHSRPVPLAAVVQYAEAGDAPVYRSAPYVAAGNYLVKTTLADDRSASLSLVGREMPFEIEKLSLNVHFTVPLSYRAMWTGEEVSPTVKYLALNGRYSEGTVARSQSEFSALGIALGETPAYYSSSDGINYVTTISSPVTKTGTYRQEIAASNANVTLTSVSALGDDGSTVTSPYLTGGKANQIFTIIPREVEIKPTFDADLYYTGSEESDRKGVASVQFYAYNNATSAYDEEVAAFASDFKINYYPSDYRGIIRAEELSVVKPTEASYYVARVLLEQDGVNDTYLTEARYTFKDGKNAIGGDLGGVAVYDNCYVDFIFRIKDQNKLDLIWNMPRTFAENGEGKVISVSFLNNFSEVALEAGEGKDYKITYLDEADNEQTEAFDTAGRYKVKLTFLKKNVAYRVKSYTGTYTKGNDLYISEGDTLLYDFEIFPPRALNVILGAPSSFYYDGAAKDYSVAFTVTEGGVDSAVTLTYGTHYKLYYYKETAEKYELVTAAPSAPGNYAVEVAFLTDLPDYTIEVDGAAVPISTATVLTIKGAAGVYADAKTPRQTFTIEKAVLVLGGLSAKDKVFDGTDTAAFSGTPTLSIKKIGDLTCGAMVKEGGSFPYTLEGEIKGSFSALTPGDSISVTMDANYTLSGGADAYYVLEYPSYSARIFKSEVRVTPVDIVREYNPFAVESIINYQLSYDGDLLSSVYPAFDQTQLLVGSLSHAEGTSVGRYPINRNTLALNDDAAGVVYGDKYLSDLFVIVIEDAEYRIVEREITLEITAGQGKVYGDREPDFFAVTVSAGSLIYNDEIQYTATRAAGENAGTYRITLSEAKVFTRSGADVSGNYRITLINGSFEITKRRLKISPRNQEETYLTGFNTFSLDVLDLDKNKDVTADYVTAPSAIGDRLSGKLSTVATEDPLLFSITRGTISVVTASNKDNSSNYSIDFDTTRTYRVQPVEVFVRITEDATLQKYYGDRDPIIAFTIDKAEKEKLGNLTLSDFSSIGRVPGEEAGEYNVYRDNTAGSFVVTDSGVDVSAYFLFTVRNLTYGAVKFRIVPRPVTVTIEDAIYENTGREVIPVIKYLNANGGRVSATVLSLLKVRFAVPQIEYQDGENLVEPVIVGDVQTDPNFALTIKPGTITMVYLQNRVTATALDSSDSIYSDHKYLLAGIMLYKSVKFYKLETANGEQPSKEVEIALPIDNELKGDNLVAVAMYAKSASKAFSFTQSGLTLVYSDNAAYYVAIAEVQEWFYVIWGVVLIAAAVLLYFLIRLIIKLVKNHKAKAPAEKKESDRKKKKIPKKKGGAMVAMPKGKSDDVPDAAGEKETDDLFSSEAVIDAPVSPVKRNADPEESITASDDLFSDEAPAMPEEASQPAPAAPVEKEEERSSDMLLTSEPEAALVAEPVAETMPKNAKEEKNGKKEKKVKEKAEKPAKKDKKKKDQPAAFTPKGFMPKGDKSTAYAPTRSFKEDLFIEEENNDSDLLSDNMLSDDSIVTPSEMPFEGKSAASDDELVVARSGGFDDEEEIGSEEKDDEDLL